MTSSRIDSNGLVLKPLSVLMVLPCMGSATHKTFKFASSMAVMSRGRCSLNALAPILETSVILPGMLSGFKCFTKETTPSPSDLSEILIPIGLEMPLKYSMCAPSGWRVRSPHHKKCAEQP